MASGGAPRNVVFISSEDSAEIDIKPRLRAGADVDRCWQITGTFRLRLTTSRDFESSLSRSPTWACFVIDPLANHVGNRDSNSEAEVRDAIAPSTNSPMT